MEIRNDLSVPIRTQEIKTAPSDAPQSAPSAAQKEASYASSPDMRDMSNAMMILQTASSVIQQALNVSSRLRTMAQSTMTTGNTDMRELAQSVAGINTALQQQGTSVSMPVIETTPKVRDTARIDEELASMERMTSAGKADKNKADDVYASLLKKQAEVKERINAAAEKMGAKGFDYETPPANTADLSRAIVSNYSSAITAQGNIRSETAGIVLG